MGLKRCGGGENYAAHRSPAAPRLGLRESTGSQRRIWISAVGFSATTGQALKREIRVQLARTAARACRTPRPNSDALPSSETQASAPDQPKSKPATRPGVFGEPWDVILVWFATPVKGRHKSYLDSKGKAKRIQSSAIAGASESLLAKLCLGTGRSASLR